MLAGGDALGGRGDADDGGYAVFAGDDGSVGHHATHFHDETRGGEEKGSPSRVSGGGNQDFARFQASARGVEDNARHGRCASG